jgi:hypothetical protein
MIPALAIITFTVTDNDMIVGKLFKRIVSKAAYVTLILVIMQARSSLIDLMAA